MSYGKDYGYPNNGYNYYPETQVDVCETGAANGKKPSWNWCTHICSVFTYLCCCWCACVSGYFGLCALICSIGSYTDYKAGDYEGYKYKKCCAVAWLLISLILGLGTLAAAGYYGYSYYKDGLGLVKEVQKTITDTLKKIQQAQEDAAAAAAAAAEAAAAAGGG